MILLNVKINNFYLFNDFEMKFSYPKKIVNSSIENEFLDGCPNFRYKKVAIIMGANATGKTCFGKLLMRMFNFINQKEYSGITELIEDTSKPAFFSLDIVFDTKELYKIETNIKPKTGEAYNSSDVKVIVKSTKISILDSYEKCVERMIAIEENPCENYIEELEKVPKLTWMFRYTIDDKYGNSVYVPINKGRYLNILESVLKIMDPRIKKVAEVKGSSNTYLVSYENNRTVIIKEGRVLDDEGLSSGTKEIIGVAQLLSGIKAGGYEFYYCDEKFSRIHSDSEKAFVSLLIDSLNRNDQLILTSHNLEVLDMNLPKHSYIFLKRDMQDNSISCVYPSEYMKRYKDSLKHAVENDMFGASPNIDEILKIKEL